MAQRRRTCFHFVERGKRMRRKREKNRKKIFDSVRKVFERHFFCQSVNTIEVDKMNRLGVGKKK